MILPFGYVPRFPLLLVCCCATICAANDELIVVGKQWELLIDQHLIDRFEGNGRLRLRRPIRREIAVVHDDPWEGNGGNYHTMFEDKGIYRMYYHAWQIPVDGHPGHPLLYRLSAE